MFLVRRCLRRVRSQLWRRWKSRSARSLDAGSSFLRVLDMKARLKPRLLQQNAGELKSFACASPLSTPSQIEAFCRERGPATIFVLDAGDDDFGSRANFGRGHDYAALEAGCPTSFDSFMARLGNIAVNSLNRPFLESVSVLGSMNFRDLSQQTKSFDASDLAQREKLISCVRTVHQRSTAVIEAVFRGAKAHHLGDSGVVRAAERRTPSLFFVNGDHNQMTAAVHGFVRGHQCTKAPVSVKDEIQLPIVINVDLHSDARPSEDGPHSGTWCTEILEQGLVERVYVVGLSPVANTDRSIAFLDERHVDLALPHSPTSTDVPARGPVPAQGNPSVHAVPSGSVVYRPFTWDAIKSGSTSLPDIADRVVADIWRRSNPSQPPPPVILTICGDTVADMPASAACGGAAGYAPDEVLEFIARVVGGNGGCSESHGRRLYVPVLSVAELKTSLQPSAAGKVGEFLTYALLLFHRALTVGRQ